MALKRVASCLTFRSKVDASFQRRWLEKDSGCSLEFIAVLGLTSGLEGEGTPISIPAFAGGGLVSGRGRTPIAEPPAGDFSPSGKLPVTFYKSVDKLPPFENYDMKGRTYRYFSGEPLYPFGYGLRCNTLAFNNLRFVKDVLNANDDLGASVAVTDTGKTAGDAIVQMYLSRPGVDGASVRSLVGRQRLSLNPGENKTVSIQVPNRNPEPGHPRRDQEDCSWQVTDLGRRGFSLSLARVSQGRRVARSVTIQGSRFFLDTWTAKKLLDKHQSY